MADSHAGWAESPGLPPLTVAGLTVDDLVAACGARVLRGAGNRPLGRLTTDSRIVEPGDTFWAIESEQNDGNRYADAAVRAGARAVVVAELPERWSVGEPEVVMVVDSGRRALGQLARWHRSQSEARIVAITGTCGKTTTKALTTAALETRLETVAAWRSFNNDLGVPWTLLRLTDRTEVAVVEIGTNAPGEIANLSTLVRPDVAVVTNVGPGHLEGLRDVAGVCREKGDLVASLHREGVAILNRDDAAFEELARRAPGRVISFGEHRQADLRAEAVSAGPDSVCFRCRGVSVEVPLGGRHQVGNALAALATAEVCGVPLEAAAAGLAACRPVSGRLVSRRLGGVWVLDDAYNANPLSMAAALETLAAFPAAGQRVAVLGDMLELGPESERFHRELGEHASTQADRVIAVGTWAEAVAAGCDGVALDSVEAACAYLEAGVRAGDVILVKASRAMGFERIVAALRLRWEPSVGSGVAEGSRHVV